MTFYVDGKSVMTVSTLPTSSDAVKDGLANVTSSTTMVPVFGIAGLSGHQEYNITLIPPQQSNHYPLPSLDWRSGHCG